MKKTAKKWVSLGDGLEYREHPTRKHGVRRDRYFRGRYTVDGKTVTVGFGWASEGWNKSKCLSKLLLYKKNAKEGRPPRTLKEEREMLEATEKANQRKEARRKQENITLNEVAKRYLAWAKENKRSARDDVSRYHHHIAPRLGNKPLSKISPFDIEQLKSNLRKAGKSEATIRHVVVLIRQMVNKANAWGLWQGINPIKGVKVPVPKNERIRFLTQEEASLLLERLKEVSPQLHDMALLSLHTGLRAGEIFNLRWRDIDLENGVIRVVDSKNNRIGAVYITQRVKTMFERLGPGKPDELVFQSRTGGKIQGVSKTFFRVAQELFNKGVTDRRQRVSFHTLRHTYASWLALQGTPILTIQRLMRHQNIAMTMRYSHLSPDVKREAVQQLEKNFAGGLS